MSHMKAPSKFVSNDSSLGGDDFYDAVEELEKQRLSSVGGASSASYGSTSRARSSVGTLVPTPAAAELMAALASADSGKHVDLSNFATAGEYETTRSVADMSEEPGRSLGLDGFYGKRSKNPFASVDSEAGGSDGDDVITNAAAGGIAGAFVRRKYWQPLQQPPSRMVITDISSSETTPVHTPPAGGSSAGDIASSHQSALDEAAGSTVPWQGRSPCPPPPLPPRSSKGSAVIPVANATTVTSKNPFAAETATASGATGSPSSNPFVTATNMMTARSPINPFDEVSPTEAEGEINTWSELSVNDGGSETKKTAKEPVAAAATTDAVAGDSKSKSAPPPLPPRKPVSSPSNHAASRWKGEEASLIPSSTRSALPSAPNGGSAGTMDTEESQALEADSAGSSVTNDSGRGVLGSKYMLVNKDTGEIIDLRELEQHMPQTFNTLLPSRRDLMELEHRRSIEISADKPEAPESKPNSPRSSLPSTLASSVAAALGKAGSRRERAKTLGSIMRRRMARAAYGTGAAASAASTGGGSGGGNPSGNRAAVTETQVDSAPTTPSIDGSGVRPAPGASGDRGSGGMGVAARVVSGALSGIRGSLKGKEPSETLAGLMLFQELQCHEGPIWAASFNQSGQFLATAGQDTRILLHKVGDLRDEIGGGGGCGVSQSGNADATTPPAAAAAAGSTPIATGDNVEVGDGREEGYDQPSSKGKRDPGQAEAGSYGTGNCSGGGLGENGNGSGNAEGLGDAPARGSVNRAIVTAVIDTTPWQILEAHRKDVVALAWSRNDFLLSASLDKTVRLWHTTQGHCLHFFKHNDIVTSVDFHPLFEHFFLSGCFDKKIRVWNIRDGRVQEWQQAPDMVTAAKFSLDGNMIVAGLIKGQVLFYQTEGMRYFTQIECRNRRGMKKRGRKVSGFAFKRTGLGVNGKETNGTDGSCGRGAGDPGYSPVFSPGGSCAGEPTPQRGGHVPGGHVPEQLLVTTNDSRLRLYNTDDFGMNAKFKGFTNDTLQLTATFSEDGKQIICGSENGKVFVWSTGIFANSTPSPLHVTPAPTSSAGPKHAATPPAVAPTQRETQRCPESFQATFEPPKIVTTACFVPESTTRACVMAVRGRLSEEVADAGGYCGCMILATDYNGALRVYCKSTVLIG